MAGTLFVVSTPIGNLEDITYRAVKVLQSASLIACEDTRQTRKLLAHFAIPTPTLSLHDHNETKQSQLLIERLEANENIALVSDAGTPLISDPGFRLVRHALDRNIPVVPIPGASSLLAALAAAGLPTDTFTFAGFLPPKQTQRQRELLRWKDTAHTIVFLEAPHRIVESLHDIASVMGGQTHVVVARELTKIHEEFIRGSAHQVCAELQSRQSVKGEITLLVAPSPNPQSDVSPEALRQAVESMTAQGVPRMDAIKLVARRFGMGKRDIYRLCEDASS